MAKNQQLLDLDLPLQKLQQQGLLVRKKILK